MDGKYPKILGSAGPNPGHTFRPCPKFVRRGRELGAVPSSARCRSCRSNQASPLFHIAPLVCLAFPALFGRGRPMWRPAVGRDDPARRLKFALYLSRGPDFRRRTGDVSPPGEVLSMDGKYPKILGPAGPNPGRTFRPCPKFVRRGHELGAAASSARCRSHLSNSRFPSFPPRASRVPCLFGFGCFVLPIP